MQLKYNKRNNKRNDKIVSNIYNSDIKKTNYNRKISTSNQVPMFMKIYKHDPNSTNKESSFNYDFIRKLGDGSASKLYLVRDKLTGSNAIVKKISKEENWREELYILELIKNKSPKLLNLIDTFENHLFTYIITEYYDNFDLYRYVDINCPYDEKYASIIIKEMARCIKVCHDMAIVHLDIKCENYIVNDITDESISLVLIDFGHSETLQNNNNEIVNGSFLYGTNYYVCPEGLYKRYSKKSDIWALGICAFLILTGYYIFWNKVTDHDRCRQKVIDQCIEHKLSPMVSDFIRNVLEFNPEDRFDIDDVLMHPYLQH